MIRNSYHEEILKKITGGNDRKITEKNEWKEWFGKMTKNCLKKSPGKWQRRMRKE